MPEGGGVGTNVGVRGEGVDEQRILRRQADDRLRRGLCARRSRRAGQSRQLRRRVRRQRGERRQGRHRAGSKPLTALFVLASITAWAKEGTCRGDSSGT